MTEEQSKEYKSTKQNTCFFCGNNKHAKRYRFWTHSYQMRFWVCAPCIEMKGGTKVVLQELEKIPLEQSKTNYFKNKIQITAVAK